MGKQATLKDKLSKTAKTAPTLTVYGMDKSIHTELYTYTAGTGDGFLATYNKYVEGTHPCKPLDDANFTGCMSRRQPGTIGTIMKNPKGFWRKVIVRHPSDLESTAETRAEGLEVLKKCFLSNEFTHFPPENIETFDATDEENPHALDSFLQDHDIVTIVTEQIDEAELDGDFYTKYPETAKRLWSGKYYPNFACGLGFP
jgi:hypothetical protein